MTTLHGKSLIAGKPAETSARAFRAISPLDSSELEPAFHECVPEDVNHALTHAEEAFAIYRHTSAEARAAFLERIAEEILALGDALPERANLETGLPLDRLAGERARTVGQLRLFAEVVREGSWVDARIDTALPDRKPLPRPDLRRMLLPLGDQTAAAMMMVVLMGGGCRHRVFSPRLFQSPVETPPALWPPVIR